MRLNKKNIFLLDGAGGVLSACFTGLLLTRYSLFLGLTVALLQTLASLALLYAAFSLITHFFVKTKKLWMLKTIIFANLFYCLISLSLILFLTRITWRGKLVLFLEIIVILLVVLLEFIVYRKNKS